MSSEQGKQEPVQPGPPRDANNEEQAGPDPRSTRRGFVRHGLTKAAYLVPAVATLAAPTSIFAASGGPSCGSVDAPCVDATTCCANMNCDMSKCCGALNFACTGDADCCGMGMCVASKCDGM
ncbi:MAG: hypothetical protein WD768_19220 [Phycisphaeraceae bacterium]